MLPSGTIPTEHALWFDINLAVKGLMAENAPTDKDKPKGKTTNKRQFLELANRAKAEVAEMEESQRQHA